MQKAAKILIVGAGPAGSTLSIFLSKKNIPHTLIDSSSFPRKKTCGDALTLEALHILKKINEGKIDSELNEIVYPCNHLDIINESGKNWRLSMPKNITHPLFLVTERHLFDYYLLKKTKHNCANVLLQTQLLNIERKDDKLLATLKNDQQNTTEEFDLIIGADGDRSIVKKYLHPNKNLKYKAHNFAAIRTYCSNIKGIDSLEFYYLNKLLPGYFWIFPMKNGLFNVGLAVLSKDVADKKLKLKDELINILQNHPALKDKTKDAILTDNIEGWSIPLNSKIEEIYGDNFLLIGDAAHIAESTTGKGIGLAMLSAEMAANTIENCIKTNKGFKAESLQEYQTKFHNQHKSTWKFLSIIQKAFRFPFIVNTIILIAKAPFISSIFNSLVGKTYSKYLNNSQKNSR